MSNAPSQSGPPGRQSSTYVEILKSTALIGGSSALSVLIGIVRTKALAVLLGPAGFGLMGIYTSVAELARSVAALGISGSGVRQIAEAAGSGDSHRIARTVIVLRRMAIVLGLFGAIVLVLFARQVSTLTFGTDEHAGAVALLSVAVFLRLVADGQGALIQGMRRISDLAKIGLIGGLLGTLASIPVVYYLREDGVVPALVAISAMATLTSWWYSRKVHTVPCAMDAPAVRREALELVKLGLAFMASGLLMTGAAYAVRLIVLRYDGLQSAGYFQAAWTLGGMYVGLILQSMGADFYPRLVGAIGDNHRSNGLVNEQAEVSLLLAGPGVIGTLTCASLVITVFYSAEFSAAIEPLRWVCLGMAMRVISWPMGYLIVAKNKRVLFFGSEMAWTVVNVGLSWGLVRLYGLAGAGAAFFGSYVFHSVMVYAIVRRLSGFRYSAANIRTCGLFVIAIGLVFAAFQTLPFFWATAFGAIATLASTAYSLRILLMLAPQEQLPRSLQRLRSKMHSETTTRLIWIDLDNSPHVPFFRPIVDELRARGYTVLLTARDAFQVTELTRLHGMTCINVGRHFGKNKLMKALGLVVRAVQLLPHVWRVRPALSVSHGSRAQTLVSKILGIKSVVIADYEHVTHVNRPDCMIVPAVIPAEVANRFAKTVLQYPGIKEDVYAATFVPDPSILSALGFSSTDIVVTARPPATEAHYHNPESEVLFDAAIETLMTVPEARVVVLPRTPRQGADISARWPQWFAARRMIIPEHAVDGLNLVWHSDLVISGGGTMNREASAIGVPVYSVFRGQIGAVDRYLAEHDRMVLLESPDDVRKRLVVAKRKPQVNSAIANGSALSTIVDHLVGLVNGR
jgi:antigen flippase